MIKTSTYIRTFTPKQRKQLQTVAQNEGFKKVPEILFFALDRYLELLADNARLERIIEMKQKKIETLKQQL